MIHLESCLQRTRRPAHALRRPRLFPPGPRVPVRPIHWLWRPYLACGNPALLDGDPGAGKSLLTDDLAARLTRGGRMPDGAWRRKKANVLFLNDVARMNGRRFSHGLA